VEIRKGGCTVRLDHWDFPKQVGEDLAERNCQGWEFAIWLR